MSTPFSRRQIAGVAALVLAGTLGAAAFAGQAHAGDEPVVTEAALTQAPMTDAPSTDAPSTEAPTTEAATTQAPSTEAPTTEAPNTEVPTTDAPQQGSVRARLDYSCEDEAGARWRVTNPADVAGTFRAVRVATGDILWSGPIPAHTTIKFVAPAADGGANTVVVERQNGKGAWVQAGSNAKQDEGDLACEPTPETTPTTQPPTTEPPVTEAPPTTPAPVVTSPAPTTAAPVAVQPAQLPTTGRATTGLALAGLAFLGAGSALLFVRRRGAID